VTSISSLIEQQQTTEKADQEWYAFIHNQAAALNLSATSGLRAFNEAEPAQAEQGVKAILYPVDCNTPGQIVNLANQLWSHCGGANDPTQARLIIEESRLQYARAAFDSVLFQVRMISSGEYQENIALPPGFLDDVKSREWRNADDICRRPISPFWVRESAADLLEYWCASQEDSNSSKKDSHVAQMLSGIALTWIDEAAHNPAESLTLMAEVTEAMLIADFYSNWLKHRTDVAKTKSDHGRKMADASHMANRAKRDKAIEIYKSGNFPSKNRAAELIAPQVGAAVRTVRDWLSHPKDPVE